MLWHDLLEEKTRRKVILLYLLEKHSFTLKMLGATLDIDERTVIRDINELKKDCQLDIQYRGSGPIHWVKGSNYLVVRDQLLNQSFSFQVMIRALQKEPQRELKPYMINKLNNKLKLLGLYVDSHKSRLYGKNAERELVLQHYRTYFPKLFTPNQVEEELARYEDSKESQILLHEVRHFFPNIHEFPQLATQLRRDLNALHAAANIDLVSQLNRGLINYPISEQEELRIQELSTRFVKHATILNKFTLDQVNAYIRFWLAPLFPIVLPGVIRIGWLANEEAIVHYQRFKQAFETNYGVQFIRLNEDITKLPAELDCVLIFNHRKFIENQIRLFYFEEINFYEASWLLNHFLAERQSKQLTFFE
jgi:hypothetical protein